MLIGKTTVPGRRRAWLVASAMFILSLMGDARWVRAEESGTKTFSSAGEACQALFLAVRDDDPHALEAILGHELTSSGAESESKLERQRFGTKYREMHRLVQEADGTTRLYVGAENWPFPVPLVAEVGGWRFDAEAGQQEILLRRVGHDEATAVRICQALERTTGSKPEVAGDDPIVRYAERLLAPADAGPAAREPFHGYYFRVVPRHTGGRKTRELTVVAYPAEYRSSGVMTFVVTDDGGLYEKDLGENTAALAAALSERRASGWHAVETEPATAD